jgi:hypothetical protein
VRARARDRPIHAAAAFFAMRCAAAGSPSSLAATVPSCAPLCIHPRPRTLARACLSHGLVERDEAARASQGVDGKQDL